MVFLNFVSAIFFFFYLINSSFYQKNITNGAKLMNEKRINFMLKIEKKLPVSE